MKAVTYTNRKGRTYTLCQTLTKKGNIRYFFTLEPAEKTVVRQIPDGYEIRENVNGQVSLRKKRAHLIRPEERAVVERIVLHHPEARNYKVDIEGKQIIIYEQAGPGAKFLQQLFQFTNPIGESREEQIQARLEEWGRFNPVLRFELVDPKTRKFKVMRMGYSGHGGWLRPTLWGSIEELARQVIPLLGTEDFFEI